MSLTVTLSNTVTGFHVFSRLSPQAIDRPTEEPVFSILHVFTFLHGIFFFQLFLFPQLSARLRWPDSAGSLLAILGKKGPSWARRGMGKKKGKGKTKKKGEKLPDNFWMLM